MGASAVIITLQLTKRLPKWLIKKILRQADISELLREVCVRCEYDDRFKQAFDEAGITRERGGREEVAKIYWVVKK